MSCVCGHFEFFFLPFSVGSFQCWVVSTSSIPAHIWQEADSRGTIHTYRRIIRVWIHLNSSPLNFTRKPSFHSLFDTGQSGCFTSQNALLHWNEWQQFLLWWQWKWRQGRFLGFTLLLYWSPQNQQARIGVTNSSPKAHIHAHFHPREGPSLQSPTRAPPVIIMIVFLPPPHVTMHLPHSKQGLTLLLN